MDAAETSRNLLYQSWFIYYNFKFKFSDFHIYLKFLIKKMRLREKLCYLIIYLQKAIFVHLVLKFKIYFFIIIFSMEHVSMVESNPSLSRKANNKFQTKIVG
jgi:hypothetical protein